VFGWRRLLVKSALSFLGWFSLWFLIVMVGAASHLRDVHSFIAAAMKIASYSASIAALFTIMFMIVPLFFWPWTRRGYGRQLEARFQQMSGPELDDQIEQCTREMHGTTDERTKRSLESWSQWLRDQRADRAGSIQTTLRSRLLSVRPSLRKLLTSAACAAVLIALGLTIIAVALLGGDRRGPIEEVRQTGFDWPKYIIGAALILGAIVPMIEAFTVRIDLTADELRKSAFGRTLWVLPREHVQLVEGDDSAWQVQDRRTNKPVGQLNPAQLEDSGFLALIVQLRGTS
jgi:hypothetical protein